MSLLAKSFSTPFLKISTSTTGSMAHPTSFSSPDSLSSLLKTLIPISSSWGHLPGSKPVTNLFLELSNGETILSLHPSPLRTVHVATLTITNLNSSLHLLESHQLMSDGTTRTRMRPLSEKMKPGESVEAAAERAVREEMGEEARVRIGSYRFRVEEARESVSYPGLPARYVLHSVEAEVEGVPMDGEFETEEGGERHEEEEGVVFVKRHFWKWVDVPGTAARGDGGDSGS